MRRPLVTALLFALAALPAAAKDEKPAWDVNAPHGKARTARFTVEEGTWMNVDVSPDGRTLAFDLLGDIYTLPIAGGTATRILGGKAFEVQPRWSPDGSQLAFTSDRGGGDNLWRADADGSDPRAVTKESFRLLNNPAWSPDGRYLVGRKHFTSERSMGAGEMWLYHVGGGDGLKLTSRKNDQQDAGQPVFSPDGHYVYFSEDVSPGPVFQYNKNPHGTIYAIRRLDRRTGEIETLVQIQGGAVSPTPSPDGRSLAFVRRVREKTVLHVMDLASGEIRPVFDGLSQDQQEAWAIFGPYPNIDWTPDSRRIVTWARGGLWSVDVATATATRIPFRAEVEQILDEPVRGSFRITDGDFTPRLIRDVATSPDGRTVVFHAVGRLWRKDLPNGRPQPLTGDDAHFEYAPAFSPDGRSLAYLRWSDDRLAEIRVRDLASGAERAVTTRPGHYATPRWSRDGRSLVYVRHTGGGLVDDRHGRDPGIYVVPAAGGEPVRVAKDGSEPWFAADGSRVLYLTGAGSLSKTLMSVGLAGEEPRTVFTLKYVDAIAPSPDGQWVAFTEGYNAYVAPLPATGAPIDLGKDTTAIPVTRVSEDVGHYLHWSAASDALHWMEGTRYRTRRLAEAFAFLPGAPKSLPKTADAPAVEIGLAVPADAPAGRVAFTGARVITMRGNEVIENATVLVEGNRIAAVGTEVAVPAGTHVVDARGKTVIPGLIDAHAHAAHFFGGPIPQRNWAYHANLAFGITTMHDPSANTQEVFSQAELVRAGRVHGPRVFSTGTILYGADGDFRVTVNSLDDARSHLRRLQAAGAFSVKSYNQPRRDQRQQINQAARELGMIVVMEGGSTFYHNLTMILDGSTGIEHNLPIAPLYADVLNLWKATDVRYTPTLIVAYGGLNGEYWWYENTRVWENEKLLRFFPRELIDARAIRVPTAPDWNYYHREVAKSVAAAQDVGVRVQVGGHGQLQGLGPHWELWMMAEGGLTPLEALRAATLDGADYLGLSRDLGSIEPGKLADLVVLNRDPREDIQATADAALVMANGRLFDAGTLAQLGNHPAPAPTYYWQTHGVAPGAGIAYGPTAPCHCPKGAH